VPGTSGPAWLRSTLGLYVMKPAHRIAWIIAGVLFLMVWIWVVGPELQYRRDVQKYRIGMTSVAIEKEYGARLSLRKTGNILPEPATEDMKRCHPAYYMKTSSAEVVFNDYYEVVRVWKRTPLLRLMWRLNPDWAAD
jgi:hypothetical protein